MDRSGCQTNDDSFISPTQAQHLHPQDSKGRTDKIAYDVRELRSIVGGVFWTEVHWFTISCEYENHEIWALSRGLEDFQEFRTGLLRKFPPEIQDDVRSRNALLTLRLASLLLIHPHHLYVIIKSLLALPSHFSNSDPIRRLFIPRESDFQYLTVSDDNAHGAANGNQMIAMEQSIWADIVYHIPNHTAPASETLKRHLPINSDQRMLSESGFKRDETREENEKAAATKESLNKSDNPEAVQSLKAQLAKTHKMYSEAKIRFYSELEETDRRYRGKLERIEKDYEVAVHYVKSAEQMLKRMKDQLERLKDRDIGLQDDIDKSRDSKARWDPHVSSWEQSQTKSIVKGIKMEGRSHDQSKNDHESVSSTSSPARDETNISGLPEGVIQSPNTWGPIKSSVEVPKMSTAKSSAPKGMDSQLPPKIEAHPESDPLSECFKHAGRSVPQPMPNPNDGEASSIATIDIVKMDPDTSGLPLPLFPLSKSPSSPFCISQHVFMDHANNDVKNVLTPLPSSLPRDHNVDATKITAIPRIKQEEIDFPISQYPDVSRSGSTQTLISSVKKPNEDCEVHSREGKDSQDEEARDVEQRTFDLARRNSGKRKISEDPSRNLKRSRLGETDYPPIDSGLNTNDTDDFRARRKVDPYTSSPSSFDGDGISKSSFRADNSDTDFELIGENDDNPDFANDESDAFFGRGEERIVDPGNYFKKLEAIERKVALNSTIRRYGYYNDNRRPEIFTHHLSGSSGPCLPKHPWSSSHISFYRDVSLCRDEIARVLFNATFLREKGYSNGSFNLLVLDSKRTTVARLVPFELNDILQLFEAFERVCEAIAPSGSVQPSITANPQPLYDALTTECKRLLGKFGLDLTGINENRACNCRTDAVHLLDLALLSYAGAHLEAFDERYLGQKWHSLKLHGDWNSFDSCGIVVQRRRLQCLDEFLGHRDVWVFHPRSLAPLSDDSPRLLLSTRIETIANVWGPMWKIVEKHSTDIVEYNIGNGTIILWHQDRATSDSAPPPLEANERYCHWISMRKYRFKDDESHQTNISSFDGTETLLIGAVETPKRGSQSINQSTPKAIGLQANMACKLSYEDLLNIKGAMKNKGALREPRTKSSRRYKDSHAIQVQGSAMGFVSVADTITYKRRIGHSMKDTLVERWRNGPRKFSELASCSGVEVSLCTQNARRRRLLDILGTNTVRKYLDSIPFTWPSEQFRKEYFESLREPKAFRRFWDRYPVSRSCIIEVISMCFDALQETGIDEDSDALSALWVENFEEEESDDDDVQSPKGPNEGHLAESGRLEKKEQSSYAICRRFEGVEDWIVTLFRSEHTWTGLLRDSTTCLTMAVMNDTCLNLENNDGYGRQCQYKKPAHDTQNGPAKKRQKRQIGFSVLQTALLLNESILKDEGLKREGRTWLHKDVKKKTRFDLGEQGSLTVLSQPITEACSSFPLVMEWNPVKSKKWQELKNVSVNEDLLGKNPEKHHQEYIRGKWAVDPLPVLILSGSNKIAFCSSNDV